MEIVITPELYSLYVYDLTGGWGTTIFWVFMVFGLAWFIRSIVSIFQG